MIDPITDVWARRERLIAGTRALVAGIALVAFTLDPAQPRAYAEIVYTIFLTYLGYAVLTAAHAWTDDAFKRRWALTTHVLDIATAFVIVVLTEGSTSAFFDFLLFPLVPATLRWRWRGTVGTAMVVTFGFGVIAAQELLLGQDPQFGFNVLMIRLVHVTVLTVVLASMSAGEDRSRRAIVNAAMWAPSGTLDEDEFQSSLARHVAETLMAPRVVLWWRRSDEPTVTVTAWSDGETQTTTEAAGEWEAAVVPEMRDAHFLCTGAQAAVPKAIFITAHGFRRQRGSPVDEPFRKRFAPASILSFRLRSEEADGRLFVLDKARLTVDDIILGTFLAHQFENSLHHRDSLQRLRDAAVIQERARLARDVHDEVLQSMTALALGLETVARLIEAAPERAREWLGELQGRLGNDQRVLRSSIQALKQPSITPSRLGWHLAKIASSVEQEWGLPVKLDLRLGDAAALPEVVAREIRSIVQEGIVNAARHARASAVHVAISRVEGEISITVDDDGRGFQFAGHYDDAERRRLRIGPVVLAERVDALSGSLAITSSTAGARLDIRIPLA